MTPLERAQRLVLHIIQTPEVLTFDNLTVLDLIDAIRVLEEFNNQHLQNIYSTEKNNHSNRKSLSEAEERLIDNTVKQCTQLSTIIADAKEVVRSQAIQRRDEQDLQHRLMIQQQQAAAEQREFERQQRERDREREEEEENQRLELAKKIEREDQQRRLLKQRKERDADIIDRERHFVLMDEERAKFDRLTGLTRSSSPENRERESRYQADVAKRREATLNAQNNFNQLNARPQSPSTSSTFDRPIARSTSAAIHSPPRDRSVIDYQNQPTEVSFVTTKFSSQQQKQQQQKPSFVSPEREILVANANNNTNHNNYPIQSSPLRHPQEVYETRTEAERFGFLSLRPDALNRPVGDAIPFAFDKSHFYPKSTSSLDKNTLLVHDSVRKILQDNEQQNFYDKKLKSTSRGGEPGFQAAKRYDMKAFERQSANERNFRVVPPSVGAELAAPPPPPPPSDVFRYQQQQQQQTSKTSYYNSQKTSSSYRDPDQQQQRQVSTININGNNNNNNPNNNTYIQDQERERRKQQQQNLPPASKDDRIPLRGDKPRTLREVERASGISQSEIREANPRLRSYDEDQVVPDSINIYVPVDDDGDGRNDGEGLGNANSNKNVKSSQQIINQKQYGRSLNDQPGNYQNVKMVPNYEDSFASNNNSNTYSMRPLSPSRYTTFSNHQQSPYMNPVKSSMYVSQEQHFYDNSSGSKSEHFIKTSGSESVRDICARFAVPYSVLRHWNPKLDPFDPNLSLPVGMMVKVAM